MPFRNILFYFFFFGLISAVQAQKAVIRTVVQYYKLNYSNFQCVRFYEDTFKNYTLKQIILVRHGKPMISKKGWVNRNGAVQYIHRYDSVPVYPFDTSPVCLDEDELTRVYSSMLTRSISTADQMFDHQIPIEHLKRFNEFQLKPICLPNIKLPLRIWPVTSRICWMLGLNDKGIESFGEAKIRAHGGAYFLEFKAEQNNKVVLVAHAFLNRYIKKTLRHQGWHVLNFNAMNYLGTYVLFKIEPTNAESE